MTDTREGFLARWSKRKVEARTNADIHQPELGRQQGNALTSGNSHSLPADAETASPEQIALENLPALDSIDATTDLSQWLKKGVPDTWKQAAISKVWAADPMINQFTGLADYAWDYNAPDGGVPGFGPMRATDDVVQMLAQAIGQVPGKPKPAEDMAAVVAELAGDDSLHAAPVANQTEAANLENLATGDPLDEKPTSMSNMGIAPIEYSKLEELQPVRRRRGGSALPV